MSAMPKVVRFSDYETKSRHADAVHRDQADSAIIVILPTELNVARVRRDVEALIDASEIKRFQVGESR